MLNKENIKNRAINFMGSESTFKESSKIDKFLDATQKIPKKIRLVKSVCLKKLCFS